MASVIHHGEENFTDEACSSSIWCPDALTGGRVLGRVVVERVLVSPSLIARSVRDPGGELRGFQRRR